MPAGAGINGNNYCYWRLRLCGLFDFMGACLRRHDGALAPYCGCIQIFICTALSRTCALASTQFPIKLAETLIIYGFHGHHNAFSAKNMFTLLLAWPKRSKNPRAGETHSTPARSPPAYCITAHGLPFVSLRDGVMLPVYIKATVTCFVLRGA
jgi:hypothetical protein